MAYIYALVDSSDPTNIRYVGKTARRIRDRLWDHKKYAKRFPNKTYRSTWINSVWRRGSEVIAVELEECDESVINEREMYWIAYYKAHGYRLTNHTDGGDGSTNMDESTRQKLRDYHTGRPFPESAKRKLSDMFKGRPSPMTGRKHTEDARSKMKGRFLGVKRPPDVVTRMARGQAMKIGKLSEDDVREIYQKCVAAAKSQREIAEAHGVSLSCVERIYSGTTWKFLNLTGAPQC